jgi:hypothetical protein
LVWGWLKENLRELEERTRGSWALSRLLERTVDIVGIGRRQDVEAYFSAESFPESANGVRKSLEVLRIATLLVERVGGSSSG